ncbi:hypothetical protein RND81_07G056200 [Saponaria officinalis]|uniref:Uncharacterized protein n=1 Tax=Saponaria officinalis TaxID=3572 RepID=A0AAW1JP95_SAPOF
MLQYVGRILIFYTQKENISPITQAYLRVDHINQLAIRIVPFVNSDKFSPFTPTCDVHIGWSQFSTIWVVEEKNGISNRRPPISIQSKLLKKIPPNPSSKQQGGFIVRRQRDFLRRQDIKVEPTQRILYNRSKSGYPEWVALLSHFISY